MVTMLTQISSLHPIQNSLQLEIVNGLSWYSSHAEQVLSLGIISGASSRFLLCMWQISSHNMACFLDEDDCVGAFKTSSKDCAEL